LKDSAMDEVTLANLSKDVSKVVDENGEPLVVYHGTNIDFVKFDKSIIGNRTGVAKIGFYFSDDYQNAVRYA